ncbi:MAG: DUF3368 domain-containing protein [Acidobacteriota bacterium]
MPEDNESRVVVVNSTPIVALALIDQLTLLQSLYQRVLIPPAVHGEVAAGGSGRPGSFHLERSSWIERVELRDPRRADLIFDLDRGEAEVIALAQEVHADLVIIDERLGRRYADRLGFRVTGTLGVLLKAKAEGCLKEVRPSVETLRRGGIHLSPQLIERVLQLAGE